MFYWRTERAAGGCFTSTTLINDSDFLYLVSECRESADHFGTKFRDEILENRSKMRMKNIKKVAEAW